MFHKHGYSLTKLINFSSSSSKGDSIGVAIFVQANTCGAQFDWSHAPDANAEMRVI